MAVTYRPSDAKPYERLSAIAGRQHGLITRQQALAAGLTPSTFKTMVRRGELERVFPSVYRLRGAPVSWKQKVMATVLWGGDGAVASHATAARLWRLPVSPTTISVTLPTRRVAPLPTVTVHRGAIATHVSIDRIPVTTASRTLLDIAGDVGPSQLEMMVDEAVSRQIASRAGLEWEMAMTGGPGRRGTAALSTAIAHLHDGHCESPLENKVLRLLIKSGLPLPVRQFEIKDGDFSARVDFAYPDAKLAIEVDGYRYHSDRQSFDADRERDARLRSMDWQVVRVTDRMVKAPETFLRAVEAGLGIRLF